MTSDPGMDLRYLIAILDRDISGNFGVGIPTHEWERWVAKELEARTFEIRGDVVWSGGVTLGRIRFHSTDEIRSSFGDQSWLQLRHPCPWVKGVLGFVSWENAYGVPQDHWTALPYALAQIGWGRAALPSLAEYGEFRDPLVEAEYPLIECTWMYGGFADGAWLLSADQRFLQAVADDVNAALREHGIGSVASAADDQLLRSSRHYTPVQLFLSDDEPVVDLQGKPIKRPERLLTDATIKIWSFDQRLFFTHESAWWHEW